MSSLSVTQLAEAYIAEKRMEHTHRYLVEGRKFIDRTDDDLADLFVATYRELVLLDDERRWDAIVDLRCEFDLRGLEVPLHRLAPEFALIKERFQQLQRAHLRDAAASLEVRDELEDLSDRLARPKN